MTGVWIGHRGSDRWLAGCETVVVCFGSGLGDIGEESIGFRSAGLTSANQPVSFEARLRDDEHYYHFRDDLMWPPAPEKKGRQTLVARIARKGFLLEPEAQATGVVGRGCAVDPAHSYAELARTLGSTFYLKEDDTVSGKGVVRIRTPGDLEKARVAAKGITGWTEASGESVNCHLLIDAFGRVVPLLPSRQILGPGSSGEAVMFEGSDFSWSATCLPGHLEAVGKAAVALGRVLYGIGFHGVCGMDMMVSDHGAVIVDLNPRFQGSSLPLSLELERRGFPPLGQIGRLLSDGSRLDDFFHPGEQLLRWPVEESLPPRQTFIRNAGKRPLVCRQGKEDLAVLESGTQEVLRGEGRRPVPRNATDRVLLALDLPRADIPVMPGAPVARVIGFVAPGDQRLDAQVADLWASLGLTGV